MKNIEKQKTYYTIINDDGDMVLKVDLSSLRVKRDFIRGRSSEGENVDFVLGLWWKVYVDKTKVAMAHIDDTPAENIDFESPIEEIIAAIKTVQWL